MLQSLGYVWDFQSLRHVGIHQTKLGKRHPLTLVYLLSFAKFLDAFGIMIMLFVITDTLQFSQDSLILLLDITSDYTKIPLNYYLLNQITHLVSSMCSLFDN